MNIDTDLVEEARGGSAEAFAEIFDRYGDGIYDFCRSVLRDSYEAEDAAQDTFMIAHQRLGSLRDPAKLRSWLHAIARRDCLNRIRSRTRSTPTDDVVVVDPGATPEAAATEADLCRLVWEAAGGLPARDRVVLDLSVRQGLDGAELADALGLERQNAYALLSNVRKRVESSLGALLVARVGRRDCDELRSMLSGWTGSLDTVTRKRIARHIEGCDTCRGCRDRNLSPAALLGAVPVVAAPLSLRGRVAIAAEEPFEGFAWETAAELGPDGYPPALEVGITSSKTIVVASMIAVAVAVVVVAVILVLQAGSPDGAPVAAVEEVAGTGGPVATETPTLPVTTTPQPAEDYCTVLVEYIGQVGTSGPAGPAPEAVEAYFTAGLTYLDRLVPIAPPEIAGDVEALRDGYRLLVEAGAASEWDLQTVATAVADDPDLEAASERFETDGRTRCGID